MRGAGDRLPSMPNRADQLCYRADSRGRELDVGDDVPSAMLCDAPSSRGSSPCVFAIKPGRAMVAGHLTFADSAQCRRLGIANKGRSPLEIRIRGPVAAKPRLAKPRRQPTAPFEHSKVQVQRRIVNHHMCLRLLVGHHLDPAIRHVAPGRPPSRLMDHETSRKLVASAWRMRLRCERDGGERCSSRADAGHGI